MGDAKSFLYPPGTVIAGLASIAHKLECSRSTLKTWLAHPDEGKRPPVYKRFGQWRAGVDDLDRWERETKTASLVSRRAGNG